MSFSRRTLLKVSAASAVLGGIGAPYVARAQSAEFSYKFANNLPESHPLVARAPEMSAAIKTETNGRFDLQVFPNNQLGSDTDVLSQVRSGGVEFFTLSGLILATLVPAASINGIGFAFPDYPTVWKAMDGDLGAYVRGEIKKAGLEVMDKIWDNGFRQTTSSTKPINGPDDFKGFKIRVPVSPLWTSMFKAFDASPASINFSEVYSALQTKIVEGQENPLALISTAKLYEVQKYCSLTNHMWDGFWFLMNRRASAALLDDIKTIVAKHVNAAAVKEREDTEKLNATVKQELAGKGLVFNQPRRSGRSATSSAPPASTPSGRASTATRPGSCSRSPSANCPDRQAGGSASGRFCYGSCRDDAGRGRRGGVTAPRRRSVLGAIDAALGLAGRNPGGDPCRRRGRHPVRGRGGALRAAHAADLVRRAGVDPVPVACDVGISGRAPPRRAHAR